MPDRASPALSSVNGTPRTRQLDHAQVRALQHRVADTLATRLKDQDVLGEAARHELGRQLIAEEVGRWADTRTQLGKPSPTPGQEQAVAAAVYAELFGLGRLQGLVDDPGIENIEIHGCDQVWVSYADGRLERGPAVADSDADLVALLQRIAARHGRSLSTADPSLDVALPDGSRLAAMVATVPRPVVTIRRLRINHLDLNGLVRLGTLDPLLARFLRAMMRARKNVIVTGRMNAGKTTLVAALAHEFPPLERFATVEKEYELRLHEMPELHPRVVAMQAREPTGEVTAGGRPAGEVTVHDLVVRALRHNLQRIVVGEARGDEVVPMLEAMTTGDGGSLCTVHARSARHAFERLVTMCLHQGGGMTDTFAYRLAAGAIDFVVHVQLVDETPIGGGRHRFVNEILEVTGIGENARPATNQVFAPGPDGRAVPRHPPACLPDLRRAGFDTDLHAHPHGTWPRPLEAKVSP